MMPGVRKILLIDDDAADRDILRYQLEQGTGRKVEVRSADRGSDGLGLIGTWQPDCVLLDLKLPDMPGLDLLRSAICENSGCPVIVITAYGSEEIAAEAMRNGAADYLIKGTLNSGTLVHSIDKVLEREALRRQVEEQRRHIEERNRELEAGFARERLARLAVEESERKYRTLAEAIPQIVWSAQHPSGEIDYVNERWSRMTGFADTAALGYGWMDLLHEEDRPLIAEKWRSSRARRVQFEAECRLRSLDGTYRWNLIRAVPVTKTGQTLTWLGTCTDLEEQKRAEQLLGQKQKLEGIGLLAGGIAHDFNNLLVGIIGAVSLTLDLLPREHESRPMLELALNSGERAAHLVRQMLAYAGKGRFLVEKVDLSELVQKTWDLVRTSVPGSIEVQFLTRPGLPPLVADASQIEQIVMNLLMNAAEAISSGQSGRIIVRTDMEQIEVPLPNMASDLEPGQYLLLEVHDNGCGMDEATQARIFDPFFTTKFTGRGLGLAAVQGIVRNNGGAILVESAPNQGTTFRILLRPGTPAAMAPNVVEIDEGRPAQAAHILVVDDEQLVLTVARAALERAGCQVTLASSGPEAIEFLRSSEEGYSLIVLDLSMPGMSGIETLAELRALNPAVPILLASGYSEAEMRQRAEGLTVSGFVQKPFTSKNLREKILSHLRSSVRAFRNRTAG
jgi:PAS domain S-box-containing protein